MSLHTYLEGYSAGYKVGRGSVGIHTQKYPVVTLCGSTKFKTEFIEAQKKTYVAGVYCYFGRAIRAFR